MTPRPYGRIDHVQGTKGAFRDYPAGIYLDGQKGEEWAPLKPYLERFDHPLWQRLREVASKSGHGGMDYVMSWRLMQCIHEGLAPDMDVYDDAARSAPAPLSEQSVKVGSGAVAFPDFRRGRWKEPRVFAPADVPEALGRIS